MVMETAGMVMKMPMMMIVMMIDRDDDDDDDDVDDGCYLDYPDCHGDGDVIH